MEEPIKMLSILKVIDEGISMMYFPLFPHYFLREAEKDE